MSGGEPRSAPLSAPARPRHRFLVRDGARIHVEVTGPLAPPERGTASARPLLLLHGFTGRASSWRPLLPQLAAGRQVVAVDLLGHGASRVADARAPAGRHRIERQAADLVAVLAHLGLNRADVLGYSMGGRLALHMAVAYPTYLGRLVLESTSPGLEDPAERAARRARDEELAAFIEGEGIRAFVDYWEALPLFASQRALPAPVWRRQRRQRLSCRPEGLAASLRGMGTGVQEPLWDRLQEVRVPVLLLAGELDARYAALAARMADALPRARVEIVPGAGHAVHLEQPELFTRHVLAFLDGGP